MQAENATRMPRLSLGEREPLESELEVVVRVESMCATPFPGELPQAAANRLRPTAPANAIADRALLMPVVTFAGVVGVMRFGVLRWGTCGRRGGRGGGRRGRRSGWRRQGRLPRRWWG